MLVVQGGMDQWPPCQQLLAEGRPLLRRGCAAAAAAAAAATAYAAAATLGVLATSVAPYSSTEVEDVQDELPTIGAADVEEDEPSGRDGSELDQP